MFIKLSIKNKSAVESSTFRISGCWSGKYFILFLQGPMLFHIMRRGWGTQQSFSRSRRVYNASQKDNSVETV